MGLMTWLAGTDVAPVRTPPAFVQKAMSAFPAQSYLPALGSMPTASGVLVSQATAMQVSAVFACVRIRSRDLARCTPQILSDDGEGTKTIVADHPLTAVFKKPNRVQTWFQFAEQLHIGFLLRSNAYAVVLRDWRGNPVELIPINPDLVTVMEAPDGSVFYNVARSGMWLAAMLADEPIMIPSADMLHIPDLTFNSLAGVSRIALARDAIGLAMTQEQQASRWSGNGARPAGVLETSKSLSIEAAQRLKQNWEQTQAGIQNTGRTAVLEDGITWKPMAMTSVDMEFNAARLIQVKEIARFYEVPLHKLGENESLPRASIAELNADYVQNVVMSDATRWEQKLAATFDVGGGLQVKLDEDQLLRADLSTMINSARTGVMSGLLTQNEGRRYIGFGPVAGGDKLLAPVNLAPNGSAADGVAPDGAGRPRQGELPGAAKRLSQGPMRKAFGVETAPAADRQVRVVISTGQIDRSGDVVVQSGIGFDNFKASRTVLWNHDQDHPVAACLDIGVEAGRLVALVKFPPEGTSAKADEVYGLIKAGVINAASIGFLPLDVEPVDGKNPSKGLRITKSDLLEFSFVSVPANAGALVLQRRLE